MLSYEVFCKIADVFDYLGNGIDHSTITGMAAVVGTGKLEVYSPNSPLGASLLNAKVGETFVLGASTWRVDAITHDRVLVSPAPGEPGRMPFWKGDAVGRPIELGRALVMQPKLLLIKKLMFKHWGPIFLFSLGTKCLLLLGLGCCMGKKNY